MDPFLGEIRIFAGNFAPNGWAMCNGQILPIQQNTALFSLMGTTYGGNGISTFALPNLQGAAPLHAGQAPGLSNYSLGQQGGEYSVTLSQNQMPMHTHLVAGTAGVANQAASQGNTWAGSAQLPYSNAAPDVMLNPQTIGVVGGGQPHNNISPYLGLVFIIALQGIFPARS